MADMNLAKIPDDWGTDHWGGVGYFPNVTWDYTVTRTPSIPSMLIKSAAGTTNVAGEAECRWYPCKVGDRVLANAWIKTGKSTVGEDNLELSGGRIGIDLYYSGPNGEWYNLGGGQIETDIYKPYTPYVSMNTPDWTLRTIDVKIPDVWFTYDYNTGTEILPVQANYFVLWIQLWSSYTNTANEDGGVWFTDTELYINPNPTDLTIPLIVLASTAIGLGVSRVI